MKNQDSCPGFLAMEIIALISVISLLAIVSLPSYISHQRNTDAACVANCFRTYATAFRNYSLEKHKWPENTIPGTIPSGMEFQLPQFDEESAVGGNWDWQYSANSDKAAICLVNLSTNEAMITRIDEIIDDGNPYTGDLVMEEDRVTFHLSR